jgi:hypothetical protein
MPDKFKSTPEEQSKLVTETYNQPKVERVEIGNTNGTLGASVNHYVEQGIYVTVEHTEGKVFVDEG